MKIAALLLVALLPEFAWSQTPAETTSPNSPSKVTRIVHVRYADAHRLAELAGSGMGASVDPDDTLRVIVLKGSPSVVTAIEQTIHELDVPTAMPKSNNVELIVSAISGSNNASAGSEAENATDIAPVIKQLRAIFPYKSYQVLSSMLLRSREGEPAENAGIIKNLSGTINDAYPSVYSIAYSGAQVINEAGKPVIRFRSFRFTAHIFREVGAGSHNPDIKPMVTQTQTFDINISTALDIREGQRIVAGKANIDSSDSALFVILMARLAD